MQAFSTYSTGRASIAWYQLFSLEGSGFGLLAISFFLHLLFFLGMLWVPFGPLAEAKDEEEVSVTFVTIERPPPSLPKEAAIAEEIKKLDAKATSEVELVADPNGMIRPKQMLSGSTLAQGNNQKARLALKEIAADERLEQLCALEAMEQIQVHDKSMAPDLLLSYPFEEVAMKGNQLIARGATFFAKKKWYYLQYECELSTDGKEVSAFAFKIGNPVPRRMWESHNLVEEVIESAEDIERYNDKTRSEHGEAR
ncbi:MAG TPA: hypothetical protein DCS30_07885 [Rhizobiales bacterium]|nr:hypothetical protein [Hyphomicrobiales bacterium]